MKKNKMIFKSTECKAVEELVKKIEPIGFDLGLDVYHYTQCAEEVRRYLLPENIFVTLRRKGGWYVDTVQIEFFDCDSTVLSELVAMLKDFGCKETNA
jgi:hypothetical protein